MDLTRENLKHTIEDFLNTEIIRPEENFFQQGILDSFDAMNLIITLEEKYGVKLEFLEFADNNSFRLDYILSKLKSRTN